MSNMAYCRFINTLADLRDCHQHMEDEDMSDNEKVARKRLISLCAKIVGDYDDDGID